MTVTNKISSKTAFKKDNSGLGSETLEQRLKIIYKNHYKLDKFIEGDVYVAQLKIDLREYKTQMLASWRRITGINLSQNALWTNSGTGSDQSF